MTAKKIHERNTFFTKTKKDFYYLCLELNTVQVNIIVSVLLKYLSMHFIVKYVLQIISVNILGNGSTLSRKIRVIV